MIDKVNIEQKGDVVSLEKYLKDKYKVDELVDHNGNSYCRYKYFNTEIDSRILNTVVKNQGVKGLTDSIFDHFCYRFRYIK